MDYISVMHKRRQVFFGPRVEYIHFPFRIDVHASPVDGNQPVYIDVNHQDSSSLDLVCEAQSPTQEDLIRASYYTYTVELRRSIKWKSRWSNIYTLTHRNVFNTWANPFNGFTRLVLYILLSVVVGLLFRNVRDQFDDLGIDARVSLLFILSALYPWLSGKLLVPFTQSKTPSPIIQPVIVIPFAIYEFKPLFKKEQRQYSGFTCALANFFGMVPFIAVYTVMVALLTFYIPDLVNFGVFYGILLLALLVGESSVYAVVSTIPPPHTLLALALASALFLINALVQGYFQTFEELPSLRGFTSLVLRRTRLDC